MTQKATIIGGGVIGGGWVARFLLNGWNVSVFDPDPEAERKIGEVLANARRALPALYDKALPAEGTLTFHDDMGEALADATWVQESVPERLDLKHKIHAQIDELSPADAVIGSSTSGFKPSELNEHGGRVVVAHPFNPVYLLPLVELVGDREHLRQGVGYPAVHRDVSADRSQRDRCAYRRPLPRGRLARGALAGQGWSSQQPKKSTKRSVWGSASAGRRWVCSKPTALRVAKRG